MDITAPLRYLTKKESRFIWDAVSEKAYTNMMQLLCKQPSLVLAYFDDVLRICCPTVRCFAEGSWSCLATGAKTRIISINIYDQRRSELRADRKGIARCGVCMRTISSIRKTLEAITNKPLACAPSRLQRMLLRHQGYTVTIAYVPGKQIPLADTLSLIFMKNNPKLPRDDLGDSVRVYVVLTQSHLSEEIFQILHTTVTDTRMEKIRTAMRLDQSMQILIRAIQSGWNNERRRYPKEVQDYWNVQDELSIISETNPNESSAIVINTPQTSDKIYYGANQATCPRCCLLAPPQHGYRGAHRRLFDMSVTPVGDA